MKGVTVRLDNVSFVLCPPFERNRNGVNEDFDQSIKLLKGTADIVIHFSLFGVSVKSFVIR